MNWPNLLALALIPVISPFIARLIEKDKEREEREIDEWEAEQEAKKARDHYALASLQPPPLLGHDSSGSDGSGSDASAREHPR